PLRTPSLHPPEPPPASLRKPELPERSPASLPIAATERLLHSASTLNPPEVNQVRRRPAVQEEWQDRAGARTLRKHLGWVPPEPRPQIGRASCRGSVSMGRGG